MTPESDPAPPFLTDRNGPATPPESDGVLFKPADVTPRIDPEPEEVRHWYWCGLLPGLSLAGVDVAGINFPIRTERVCLNGRRETIRHRKRGVVVPLSRSQLRKLGETLRHKVVRTRGGVDDLPQAENIGDQPRPSTTVLTIPTAEDQQARQERQQHVRSYIPQKGDRPLADFLWLQPTDRAEHRFFDIDSDPPPPISETGIIQGRGPVAIHKPYAGLEIVEDGSEQ